MTKNLMTILVALAIGCGGTKDDAKPGSADKPAAVASSDIASDDDYVTKGSAMVAKMVDLFKTDGASCDKLADDLAKLRDSPEVATLDKYQKAHPAVKKKLDAAVADKMKDMEAAGAPARTACKVTKKLRDVMSKFGD